MGSINTQSAWSIDLSAWPVVVVKPKDGVSDAQLRQALSEYDHILVTRPGPYVLLMDNSHSPGLSAAQRKIIAEYNAHHEMRTRARCRGIAFVMTSAFVRGIMTAVFWIKQPPTESKVFDTLHDAMHWAVQRAATPPSLRPAKSRG